MRNMAGIEGVTFEVENMRPRFMSHIKESGNPQAKKSAAEYGIGPYLSALRASKYHDLWRMDFRNTAGVDAVKMFGTYPVLEFVVWSFTDEEQDAKAEIEQNVLTTFKQETLEFVMRSKDIHDDAQWQAYVEKLEKAGLRELEEYYQAAYERWSD